MTRQRSFSGVPWESEVAYCRALRVGNQVFIKGTAPAAPDGSTWAPGDAYAQATRCFVLIAEALADVGAEMSDVVRTRMFVTDIERWAEFGRAHREAFEDHPPVATMVEVKGLIDPQMLIEIEVDAVCSESPDDAAPSLGSGSDAAGRPASESSARVGTSRS